MTRTKANLGVRQKYELHVNLLGFQKFARDTIPIVISNTLLILTTMPRPVNNPILLFLLKHAIDRIVERLVLDVVEAGNLVDLACKEADMSPVMRKHDSFADTVRVRNKIIAHQAEANILEMRLHRRWFESKYNDYRTVLELVSEASDSVSSEVQSLIDAGIIRMTLGATKNSRTLKQVCKEDIEQLANCLSSAGLY